DVPGNRRDPGRAGGNGDQPPQQGPPEAPGVAVRPGRAVLTQDQVGLVVRKDFPSCGRLLWTGCSTPVMLHGTTGQGASLPVRGCAAVLRTLTAFRRGLSSKFQSE